MKVDSKEVQLANQQVKIERLEKQVKKLEKAMKPERQPSWPPGGTTQIVLPT